MRVRIRSPVRGWGVGAWPSGQAGVLQVVNDAFSSLEGTGVSSSPNNQRQHDRFRLRVDLRGLLLGQGHVNTVSLDVWKDSDAVRTRESYVYFSVSPTLAGDSMSLKTPLYTWKHNKVGTRPGGGRWALDYDLWILEAQFKVQSGELASVVMKIGKKGAEFSGGGQRIGPFLRKHKAYVTPGTSLSSSSPLPSDTRLDFVSTSSKALGLTKAYDAVGVEWDFEMLAPFDDSNLSLTYWTEQRLTDVRKDRMAAVGGADASAVWVAVVDGGAANDEGKHISAFGWTFDRVKTGMIVFNEKYPDRVAGAPANAKQHAANRSFLFTWVHELGHTLGLSETQSRMIGDRSIDWRDVRSWMAFENSDPDFWKTFQGDFHEHEAFILAHGPGEAITPGLSAATFIQGES